MEQYVQPQAAPLPIQLQPLIFCLKGAIVQPKQVHLFSMLI